ncbi:hypothetical protein Taro_007083 [Colocasia esculenta]|uniref:Uncharacterized protein n=1 Tax=Colocasia esculenta TaxID=4460 RepID=A0A843TX57_COLES|nr:hypothetical protein [Colocasia esculenta]
MRVLSSVTSLAAAQTPVSLLSGSDRTEAWWLLPTVSAVVVEAAASQTRCPTSRWRSCYLHISLSRIRYLAEGRRPQHVGDVAMDGRFEAENEISQVKALKDFPEFPPTIVQESPRIPYTHSYSDKAHGKPAEWNSQSFSDPCNANKTHAKVDEQQRMSEKGLGKIMMETPAHSPEGPEQMER